MKSLFDIKGKVAVVTGGRIGIGRSITCGLIEHGVKVLVVAKSPDADELKKMIKKSYDTDLNYISCDLSKPDSRRDLGKRILDMCGRIDILINNAGDQARGSFLAYSHVQWESDIQLLLSSVFDLSQQVANIMVSTQTEGRIINIGSISSFQGAKNIVGYITCKHGLIGLTKSMSVELAAYKINVNCIAPGFIDTELLRKSHYDKETIESRIPKNKIGTPDDVLGTILYLCSDASKYVTGVTIPVDGGWMAR